ncbi:MAG: hypothetical protein K8Q88_06425, partial [Nitrosarchaeum sp.]|nr:hypothetical protein [Nitrosarchaeum sp.]
MKSLVYLSIFTVLVFTLFLSTTQDVYATLTYQSTLGVTGESGSDNDHFTNPYSVAVDSSGKIYVTDLDNQR